MLGDDMFDNEDDSQHRVDERENNHAEERHHYEHPDGFVVNGWGSHSRFRAASCLEVDMETW